MLYIYCHAALVIEPRPLQLWKFPFAQVIFDSDPAVGGSDTLQQQQEMSQAMIR